MPIRYADAVHTPAQPKRYVAATHLHDLTSQKLDSNTY